MQISFNLISFFYFSYSITNKNYFKSFYKSYFKENTKKINFKYNTPSILKYNSFWEKNIYALNYKPIYNTNKIFNVIFSIIPLIIY
jgi:hypothetical protein